MAKRGDTEGAREYVNTVPHMMALKDLEFDIKNKIKPPDKIP
jgi:hypothetical protein